MPRFAPSEFNFGRYLSYRMEELGVKHFFTVPGIYLASPVYSRRKSRPNSRLQATPPYYSWKLYWKTKT